MKQGYTPTDDEGCTLAVVVGFVVWLAMFMVAYTLF